MDSPGPAIYHAKYPQVKRPWTEVQVLCFMRDSDFCVKCSKALTGDYYKSKGKGTTWCNACFTNLPNRERIFVQKVRHCSCFHKHIGVDNITVHTTTLKRLKKLQQKELCMWNKFGENATENQRLCKPEKDF